MEIMLGHIEIATESLLIYPNRKAGILFVGIFFMLSGYGLSYGVSHKETYLERLLLKKLLKVLIPAVIIWIVARDVAAVVFCMIVCSFLYKVQLFNPVSHWLGKCSYEIYLIHFYVISILQQYISNKILLSSGIIMITLFLAYAAYFLKMFIQSRLERIA